MLHLVLFVIFSSNLFLHHGLAMLGGRTRLGKKRGGGAGGGGVAGTAQARKLKKSRTTSALGNLPPPPLPYYNYDTW